MEHLFANTWVYVGHDSQVPNAGDYYGTTIGKQPVMMVRHTDGVVHVLYNRCPHKGTRITIDTCGNAGKFFRCPYHAWSFRTDGSLLAIPLRKGYEHTGLEESHAIKGIAPVKHVKNYRGFVFAKMNDAGEDFEEYFGESLSTIDNMVDRSPAGRLEVAGGVLRYMHNCNWKMLVENLTDTCHPMVAHESSAGHRGRGVEEDGARQQQEAARRSRSMRRSCRPTSSSRRWASASGATATATPACTIRSIRTIRRSPAISRRWSPPMAKQRAKAILDENRHNTSYFPNFMVKGPIQAIRLFKPIAPEPDAGRILDLPSGRCAGPAARAHADLQPADQRADLDRRPRRPRNVRARPGGPARRRQSVGQHSAALRSRRSRAGDRGDQRHVGMADAQPVPRLVEIHDDVDVTAPR